MPQYVHLKLQAMDKARSIREKERALWQELFEEEEKEELYWLFEPVFGPVCKAYQF